MPDSDCVNVDCCIVGGGPAGVVLSLLLARRGVRVTLLEAHHDFDREFRGDTLHPSTMELMQQLGLADELLSRPHTKLHFAELVTASGAIRIADFSRLRTPFPFITVMPQSEFLEYLVEQARQYNGFELRTDARVRELLKQNGTVAGVRYRSGDDWIEIRSPLVVAADGRFSTIRKLASLEAPATSPPMDVIWFRLPRSPNDEEDLRLRLDGGHMIVSFNRGDHWQVGFVIVKGQWKQIKAQGIESFRETVRRMAPPLASGIEQLTEWSQTSLLNVQSDCLAKWYLPGLLLIGDAAHVMSPVGGVGINYAIQDAVATANVVSQAVRRGGVSLEDLVRIQRSRRLPTQMIQLFQRQIQQRIIRSALRTDGQFRLPWLVRIPLVRRWIARFIAFGFRRPKLND